MNGRDFVTFAGIRRPLLKWCRIVGLPLKVVKRRLKDGLSVNEALTRPENPQGGWQQLGTKAHRKGSR